MYSINPTSRFTLITPDECTAKLPQSSLDSTKWQAAIEIAEARFAIPVLGWDMYTDITNQKNIIINSGNIATYQAIFDTQFGYQIDGTTPRVVLVVGQIVNSVDLITTTPSYVTLWNQALWNYVFNAVWFVALTENYSQFTSSGIQKSNPLDSAIGTVPSQNVGISLADLRYLSDRWVLDRINVLQRYMEQFICKNKPLYPLYPQENCSAKWDKTGDNLRTTTFIDIYEDCWDRDVCSKWDLFRDQ